jgi:hypothetical protein
METRPFVWLMTKSDIPYDFCLYDSRHALWLACPSPLAIKLVKNLVYLA